MREFVLAVDLVLEDLFLESWGKKSNKKLKKRASEQ